MLVVINCLVFVEAIFVVVSPIHRLISSVEQIRWSLTGKLKEVARLVSKRWHKECNMYCLPVGFV